jgi:hypothetical protein
MLDTESDPVDPLMTDPPEGQGGGGTTVSDTATQPTQPKDPPEGQSGGGTT